MMTRDVQPALCGAKTRAGSPCAKSPGWGTHHVGVGRCRLHGGSSPRAEKAGQEELARCAVVTYGLPRQVEPHQALIEELHRTAGHVAWLSAEINLVMAGDPSAAAIEDDEDRAEYVRLRLDALMGRHVDERKHLVAVAKTCIDVGVEERRVRLAEEQGAFIASVLRGVLTDLGVRLDDPETERVVRRHLNVVS